MRRSGHPTLRIVALRTGEGEIVGHPKRKMTDVGAVAVEGPVSAQRHRVIGSTASNPFFAFLLALRWCLTASREGWS